ncbi:hypothetical protein [Xanthobacter sediminis]
MSDHEPMDAQWIDFPPDNDGSFRYYVGGTVYFFGATATITRITVQQDLPGMYCNMRRVCVWAGDKLAFEAPLHNVQGVGYLPAKEPVDERA